MTLVSYLRQDIGGTFPSVSPCLPPSPPARYGAALAGMSLSPGHGAADPGGSSNPVSIRDRADRKQWEFNSLPLFGLFSLPQASRGDLPGEWSCSHRQQSTQHPSSALGQHMQILQPRCVTRKRCLVLNNSPEFSQVLQCFKPGVCFNKRDQTEPMCPRLRYRSDHTSH